jgi:site-specific DNA recombinase
LARAKQTSLLGGFVFDAAGERLTPTYAVKKGTRYRYYISASLMRVARQNRSGGWRIPAGDLESLVINRIHAFLADPAALLDAIEDGSQSDSNQGQLIKLGRQLAQELRAETPDKVKATLMALRCRVAINPDRIEIHCGAGSQSTRIASK